MPCSVKKNRKLIPTVPCSYWFPCILGGPTKRNADLSLFLVWELETNLSHVSAIIASEKKPVLTIRKPGRPDRTNISDHVYLFVFILLYKIFIIYLTSYAEAWLQWTPRSPPRRCLWCRSPCRRSRRRACPSGSWWMLWSLFGADLK